MQNKLFSVNKTLKVNGTLVDLTTPRVMGILNVTPDSFFDGGRYLQNEAILEQAGKMVAEGADFIDVGGYSSRPGATDISAGEETNRVVPAIQLIKKEFPSVIISVDTFRAGVARKAVEAGASMINDISGGQDDAMFATVAALQVPYILMHMKGTPRTMTQQTQYTNLLKEITDYSLQRIGQLHALHVKDILVDPGFGFAKNTEQNFTLLNQLNHLHILSKPLLVGLSRKSMIWKTLETTPDFAQNGTTVLNTIALMKGASILRVHDVKEAKEAIRLVGKLAPQPN